MKSFKVLVCLLFMFGAVTMAYAQEKAAEKTLVVVEEVVEDTVVTDKAGNPVAEEVDVVDVVEEVPVTTLATTASADIK